MLELIVGRPAVLVIDMQNDFVDGGGSCYAPWAEPIIPSISRVVDAARRAGVPVIYTQETHRPGRVDSGREGDAGAGAVLGLGADAPIPEHTVEGTWGHEIVDALTPAKTDHRVLKRRYNAFLGTDLDLLLRDVGAETLLVTGVNSNMCVLCTVLEGHQLDYHVRVIEDCVAGTTLEEHEAALHIMRKLTVGVRYTAEDVTVKLLGERAAS